MNSRINQGIKTLLKNSKRIAVVGLSDSPFRPSNQVARYLMDMGYEVIPVNPGHETILGQKSYPDLKSIPVEIDIVNVFRRREHVAGIVDATIGTGAKAIWLQLGVVDEKAALKALEAGLQVVMDRCIKIEHRRFRIESE